MPSTIQNQASYHATPANHLTSEIDNTTYSTLQNLKEARCATHKALQTTNQQYKHAEEEHKANTPWWRQLGAVRGSEKMSQLHHRQVELTKQLEGQDEKLANFQIGAMRHEFDNSLARVLGVSVKEVNLLTAEQKLEQIRKFSDQFPAQTLERFENFEIGFGLMVEQERDKQNSPMRAWLESGLCHLLPNALHLGQHLDSIPLDDWLKLPIPGAEASLVTGKRSISPSPRNCPIFEELHALSQSFESLQNKTEHFMANIGLEDYWPEQTEHPVAFNLLTGLPEFPKDFAIRIFNPKGERLSDYTPSPAAEQLNFINLTFHPDGKFSSAGQAACKDPLAHIVPGLPSYSDLGKGRDFSGAKSTKGQAVIIREKLKGAAEKSPVGIYKAMRNTHADSPHWSPNAGQLGSNSLNAKLMAEFPKVPESLIEHILANHALSEAQRNHYLYEGGSCPATLYTALRQVSADLEHIAQTARDQDYIRHPRTYDSQADARLRATAAQALKGIGLSLHILKPGEQPAPDKLGTSVTLYDYRKGSYSASPSERPYVKTDAKTDSFFTALRSVLSDTHLTQLGLAPDSDSLALRTRLADNLVPPLECAPPVRLHLPPDPPQDQFKWNKDWGRGYGNYEAQAEPLNNHDSQNSRYNAVGRLNNRCTAFLVDGPAEKPAQIITNAHCVDLKPGEVVENVKLNALVEFGAFQDKPPFIARTDQVKYGNYRNSDLAIIDLKESPSYLVANNVTPFILTSDVKYMTPIGHDLVISGYPGNSHSEDLQLSTCVRRETALRHYHGQVISHDCRKIIGGASGSPIIDRTTGQVIAVSSQGRIDGLGGLGVPTFQLNNCLGPNASEEQCMLLPASKVEVTGKLAFRKPKEPFQSRSIEAKIVSDHPYVLNKVVTNPNDCRHSDNYDLLIRTNQQEKLIEMKDPTQDNFLCTIPLSSPNTTLTPGKLHNTLITPVESLPVGPTEQPSIFVKPIGAGYYDLEVKSSGQLHAKQGKALKVDCADPKGYRPEAQGKIQMYAGRKDIVYCAKNVDPDGQESKPARVLMGYSFWSTINT
ncbi:MULTISPECIES: trypsin-like serine peptidase [Pseudomonas]|uniref:Trypsin-like peptidase domain-containing protein n=1 Tax=Pseudomonas quercus TaxID=2722792 RepID=A0ABX0YEA9_9PSED|nr:MULTISPECIES: serine protease [Pseudomonas]MBF7142191.1 trypsin-like peptidase domain-containing protein [Pseudomonas sp. LY10J]NJP00729.1 trypsin-like peptidase domain-containing protein [Pseudomonas quercus]